MKIVEFDSQFTEKEFVNAYTALIILILKPRKFLWIFPLLPFIIFGNTYFQSNEKNYMIFTILLIIPIFFIIFKNLAKKTFATSKHIGVQTHYYFDDKIYRAHNENANVEVKINSFIKISSFKEWIYLFTNKQTAIILKKADIPSEKINILKQIFNENGVENNL